MAVVVKADVVVYGGGHGGALIAKELTKRGHKVILVDPNTYLEVCSSVVRSLVQPDFAKRALIPLEDAMKSSRFVYSEQFLHGRLFELKPNGNGIVQLHTNSQENPAEKKTITINAKSSVICTGQHYKDSNPRSSSEYTIADRLKSHEQFAHQIQAGKSIVIAGGGSSGIEFAAEVAYKYPKGEKKITIVNGSPRLIAGNADSVARVAAEHLLKRGVTILNNTLVVKESKEDHTVLLSNGETLDADIVFWATGGKPNSDFMKAHWSSSLNANGEILVSHQFVVKGSKDGNIFALSDVAYLDGEPKIARLTLEQWSTAVYNVDEFLKGSSKRKSYNTHPGYPQIGLTLGPTDGVFQLPYVGTVSWGWFARKVKSKDMQVGPCRKMFGLD